MKDQGTEEQIKQITVELLVDCFQIPNGVFIYIGEQGSEQYLF